MARSPPLESHTSGSSCSQSFLKKAGLHDQGFTFHTLRDTFATELCNLTATFSEAMQASTINTTTFRLRKSGTTTNVAAAVSYDPTTKRATLNPNVDLKAGASYVATVTTGAKDQSGNQLDQDPNAAGNQARSWQFKVKP